MQKKWLWATTGILVAAAIAGSLVFIKIGQFQAMGAAAETMVMPPQLVNVIEVREEIRQPTLTAVGTVKAVNGTAVSTEADGVVREILFKPGTRVNAGAPLLQLDIELEEAQLRAAEAAALSSQLALKRVQELRRSNSVSQADIDIAISNSKQAEAQADYIRALIAKKTVRAPFSGKLGIRAISEGDFLPKGTAVVSLQALEPIYIEFSLPQQRLAQLENGLTVTASTDAYPDKEFKGNITAISPDIDVATRNVRVQATLANAEELLRPGMYVALQVHTRTTQKILLVPETGIMHGTAGDTVFVIEHPESTEQGETYEVVQKNVKVGPRTGDFAEIIEGVNAGERVISTGVFKLQPGTRVLIDQRLAPEFSTAPQPDNT
jgi:membrane fusion protein (multidrug efflux system)